MAISISPYTEDFKDQVRGFNGRLRGGGASTLFPEQSISWLPKRDGRQIYEEYFLARQDSFVRGGYILKTQDFLLQGNLVPISCFRYPVSEGCIDKAYSIIVMQLLTHALKKRPFLFSLGMGGLDYPLPKIQKAMGWFMRPVPFYFRVCQPTAFFKNLSHLRSSALRRFLSNTLSASRLGWGIKIAQVLVRQRHKERFLSIDKVPEFSDWTDELWHSCKESYSMIAVRDKETLNILYPSIDQRFIRLKISENHRIIGWVVALNTKMSCHNHFGNMQVGSIVDCLAAPKDALSVIVAATRYLEERGADLIVSNQTHTDWTKALRNSGYLQGPSNFIFSASKALTQRLQPLEIDQMNIHLNRGDCDGPINL